MCEQDKSWCCISGRGDACSLESSCIQIAFHRSRVPAVVPGKGTRQRHKAAPPEAGQAAAISKRCWGTEALEHL